jgi:hypothetical protein
VAPSYVAARCVHVLAATCDVPRVSNSVVVQMFALGRLASMFENSP